MLNQNLKSGLLLVLSDARGVFIPRDFASNFDLSLWSGIDAALLPDLSDPMNEGYWDTWQTILDNATFQDDGHTWHLTQDGDLWAYCPELMTNKERAAMGFDFESDYSVDGNKIDYSGDSTNGATYEILRNGVPIARVIELDPNCRAIDATFINQDERELFIADAIKSGYSGDTESVIYRYACDLMNLGEENA